MKRTHRPKVAVWKFASCDGCQLALLDCEDELLAIADAIQIASFPEASRAVVKGPYDLSLVEGSITTPHDAERIHAIRSFTLWLFTLLISTAKASNFLRNDVSASVSAVLPIMLVSLVLCIINFRLGAILGGSHLRQESSHSLGQKNNAS